MEGMQISSTAVLGSSITIESHERRRSSTYVSNEKSYFILIITFIHAVRFPESDIICWMIPAKVNLKNRVLQD